MLGIAFQLLGDYENAELIFKQVISTNPAHGRAMLRLSEICMELGKYTDGTHYYYEGLLNLKESDVFKDLFSEIQILMSLKDQNKYANLTLEDKGLFIKKFWKSKDPTPTTELNERYTEHFQRVKYARHNFSSIVSPYYDDRGKIYVKYGPPDAKHIAQDYQDGAKPNESWSYEQSVYKGLTFDFVKKGPVYYQVHDLSEASPTGIIGQSRDEWLARLYEERAGFTDSYNRFLNRYGPDLQKEISDFSHDRIIAESRAPSEIYFHMSMEKELPFVYNFSQFKGSPDESLLEIYLGVAYKNLKFNESMNHIYSPIYITMVVMDTNYNDIYRNSRNINVKANTIEETSGKLFIDLDSILLPPGDYNLALAMTNPSGNAKGEYQNPISIRDFNQTNLLISDIQLSSQVEPTDEKGLFVKNKYKVIPYPYAVIKRQQPIYIYYEIYNLKFNSSGQTDYTIDQTIKMISQKRSFFDKTVGALGRIFSKRKSSEVSTSYHQTGDKSTSVEYLSIHMEKIPTGTAQISLKVTDNTTGETCTQNREFELID
jgi:GWxTD domain-containing protein